MELDLQRFDFRLEVSGAHPDHFTCRGLRGWRADSRAVNEFGPAGSASGRTAGEASAAMMAFCRAGQGPVKDRLEVRRFALGSKSGTA
jgi:hypothetical protein